MKPSKKKYFVIVKRGDKKKSKSIMLYDGIINVTSALDECIGDWISDIEQLVGAPQ